METSDGKSLGESFQSDHIIQHFKEGYAVPSLVYRACKRFGISPIAGSYLVEGFDGYPAEIAKAQIKKAVYRFLKTQFHLAG